MEILPSASHLAEGVRGLQSQATVANFPLSTMSGLGSLPLARQARYRLILSLTALRFIRDRVSVAPEFTVSKLSSQSWRSVCLCLLAVLSFPLDFKRVPGFWLHVCRCTMCVCSACRGQKKAWDHQELVLQVVVATMWVVGIEPRSSEEQPVL